MPALTDQLRDRVRPGIARFLRWWVDELAWLVPSAMMEGRRARGRRAVLIGSVTGTAIERVVGGAAERYVEDVALPRFTDAEWDEAVELTAGLPVAIVLTPALVHKLTLRLPRAAGRHLATTIPLQLLDHAPILPHLLTWRVERVLREDKSIVADVVIVRTALLDAIAAAFVARDRPAPSVYAEIEGRRTILRRSGGRPTLRVSRPWAIATAIVLATPVAMLLALQIAVGQSEHRLATEQVAAEPRILADRRVRAQAAAAAGLRAVLGYPSVIGVVDDLAVHVPRTVHATEMTFDGGMLAFTLVGPSRDTVMPTGVGRRLVRVEQMEQVVGADGAATTRYRAVPR